MPDDLRELLNAVVDEPTFLVFTRALAQNRRAALRAEQLAPSSPFTQDAGGWENTSIEDFLESAVAWAEASEFGRRQDLAGASVWRLFANFLYAGKIYE